MAEKKCSRCEVVKPLSGYYKHKLSKDGHQYWCKSCLREVNKKYEESNLPRLQELRKEWRRNNKARESLNAKKWRAANPEKAKAQYARSEKLRDLDKRRAWRLKNADKEKAKAKKWRQQNPHKCRAFEGARRAIKKVASPKWADYRKMAEIYREAAEKKLSVDHIVPLNSPIVCGLHVHHNLQLLPLAENIKKGNRWWPDMP